MEKFTNVLNFPIYFLLYYTISAVKNLVRMIFYHKILFCNSMISKTAKKTLINKTRIVLLEGKS